MKKIVLAILLICTFSFQSFAAEEYHNPDWYSDSAKIRISNFDDETFILSIYESSTKELISVCTVKSGERFVISLMGSIRYDFIISSPTKDKSWKNYLIKRGGIYNVQRNGR